MEKVKIIELLDNVLQRQQHCHIVASANELKYFKEQSFQSIVTLEEMKEGINNPKQYTFIDEKMNEVTILATVGDWCMVIADNGSEEPYVLPLELVDAIRTGGSNESVTS